jgi:MoaA/NifB/PqqE/SkfB family radical SAM enzyme
MVQGGEMLDQNNPLKIATHIIDPKRLNEFLKGKANPITVEINPTNVCNHGCSWCYFKEYKNNVKESIPRDILFKLIDDIAGNVNGIIISGGGEPTLHPSFSKALYRARIKGLDIGLITNGSTLGQYAPAIADTCSWVRVSLDAITAEEHEKVHNSKDFSKIIDGVKHLVEIKGKNMQVGASFTYENGADLDKIDKFKHSLGLDYAIVRGLRENKPRSYSKCLANNLISAIGPDAKVYVCCSYLGNDAFSFGNLKEKSFWEIWNGKKRKEVMKKIDVGKCPSCRYDTYNEILNYLAGEKKHRNFL